MDAGDGIEIGRLPAGSVGSGERATAGQPAPQAGASAEGERPRESAELGELVVPEFEPTGHADVDAALERLRELSERPTGAHPDLYDGVHQRLQDVLAQIDHQDVGR